MATGFPEFQLTAKHILADAEPSASDGTHTIALFVDNIAIAPSLVLAYQRDGKEARNEWMILERYWTMQADDKSAYRTPSDNVLYRGYWEDIVDQVGEEIIFGYIDRINAKLEEILGAPGEEPTDGGDTEVKGRALMYTFLAQLEFKNRQIVKKS